MKDITRPAKAEMKLCVQRFGPAHSKKRMESDMGSGIEIDHPKLTHFIRASFSSAATAKCSASKTAKPNPSSSNARILAASPGQCYAGDREGRVSLRYHIGEMIEKENRS